MWIEQVINRIEQVRTEKIRVKTGQNVNIASWCDYAVDKTVYRLVMYVVYTIVIVLSTDSIQ